MKHLSINGPTPARSGRQGLLLLACLLGAALLCIIVSGEEQALQKRVQTFTAPLFNLPALFLQAIRDGVGAGHDWFATQREIDALRVGRAQLQRDNALLRLQLREAEAGQRLLGYRQQFGTKLIPARVIGHSTDGWPSDLFLDRGSDDGVFLYQSAVMSDTEGLYYVGRIVSVGSSAATLRPLIFNGIKVPAMLEQSGRRGLIMAGQGRELCQLLYVPPELPVRIGEAVVSSGEVAVVPPGLRLGTVCAVGSAAFSPFQDIQVTPYGDPYLLPEVLLLASSRETQP